MPLTKRVFNAIFQVARDNKADAYGSLIVETLKGGVIYKVYFKMLGYDKHQPHPAYIKLIFPDKSEFTAHAYYEVRLLEEALASSNKAQLTRYKFITHNDIQAQYLYILRIGKERFDLREDLAKAFLRDTDIAFRVHEE